LNLDFGGAQFSFILFYISFLDHPTCARGVCWIYLLFTRLVRWLTSSGHFWAVID